MSTSALMDKKLRSLGFRTLDEFLVSRPGVGCIELARELGSSIRGIDLDRAILTNGRNRGQAAFRAAARDLLARHLREILVSGWGRLRPDDPADLDKGIVNASATGIWSVQVAAIDKAMERRADAVVAALESIASDGWVPADADDVILCRAFELGWPLVPQGV